MAARRSCGINRPVAVAALLSALLSPAQSLRAQAQTPRAGEAAFRDLYKELIEINTTLSAGSCTAAAEAMATRLKAAGLPASDMQILVPADRPKDAALIATLRGQDRQAKPILLLAHVDVLLAGNAEAQSFGTVELDLRQHQIRLHLLGCRTVARHGGLALGKQMSHFRRIEFDQYLTLGHAVAKISTPAPHVAIGAGIDRRFACGLDAAGQAGLATDGRGFRMRNPHSRFGIRRRCGCSR